MSTAAPADTAADAPAATAPGADARPGLGRLTLVELRKTVDTRAGFWLAFTVAGLVVAIVALVCAIGNDDDRTLLSLLTAAVTPAALLLPVVGILLVSSEWSQRTAQVTFALVPRRARVLVAKVAASLVLSLAAFALSVAVAAIGTAIVAPHVADRWSLSAGMLGQLAFYVATAMVMGVAFGAVLLNSAPAIVLYFVLPTAWSVLGSLDALAGPARWLDGGRSLEPLTDHLMSATEWARAGTTLALWLALPLALGLWRIARGEIR